MPQPRTRIAAHRGGAILWPENSPTAFRNAARLAVEQVELDAHLSADGAVVVIHDATLDRTTEASGPVRAQSLAALRGTRLKGTGGEAVPTLAEVAAIFRETPIGLRLELKRDAQGNPYPDLLPRVTAVLEEAGIRARTTITSFAAPLAGEAARHGGFADAIWLVSLGCWRDLGAAGVQAAARAWDLPAVGLHQSVCEAGALRALREAGLAVGAWAVNEAEAMRRMLALGVDVFTTDDPLTALALRAGEAA
ncbi:glycerophosphodiester phosphodiesterase family protein [Roseomonas sp. E05]|uniref:glycerophosphodiester phosphodiesterase family protein n=1 Tax=Roseomonas sp. E05 TaxID=3046310 RepID=UPI0024BAEC6C|nr:glycerophosphodiester phosphodiesterase family protein [Roseomonas sp. E05]MDJ0386901.1 glycerophosphodiester phosphodiesterase family protein [Roseomonas sp. E05]